MIRELRISKDVEEAVMADIKVLSQYLPGGIIENHKNPQDNRCPGRELKRERPESEAGILITPRRSVKAVILFVNNFRTSF
jgi:hypothetical protein